MKKLSEAQSVLDSIRRLVRALRVYSREAEGRLNLSAAQLFVLQLLRDEKPVSLKELASRTYTDISSVSVVVDRLVGKGLMQRRRSEKDGRVLELWLSAEGKLVLRQHPDALQLRLLRSLDSMPLSRRKVLAAGLRELLQAAGLDGEKPVMLFEAEA